MALVTKYFFNAIVPNANNNWAANYTLGIPFTPGMSVTVKGIGYYRWPGSTGTRVALLYNSVTQALLASKNFSGDTTDNAWNYQLFDTPYVTTAGATYVAAFYKPSNNIGGLASNSINPFDLFTNPVNVPTSNQGFYSTADLGVPSFPATANTIWYGMDVVYEFDTDNLPTLSKKAISYRTAAGFVGICFGGPSSSTQETMYRNLTVGARKELVEGNPAPPSLALDIPSSYRFRWGVKAGTRTFSTSVKQVSNVTGKRPRVIIRANPAIGVNADVVTDAGSGTGWVNVGPITVTPSSDGVLFVEFWNMDTDTVDSPAYFGRITRT